MCRRSRSWPSAMRRRSGHGWPPHLRSLSSSGAVGHALDGESTRRFGDPLEAGRENSRSVGVTPTAGGLRRTFGSAGIPCPGPTCRRGVAACRRFHRPRRGPTAVLRRRIRQRSLPCPRSSIQCVGNNHCTQDSEEHGSPTPCCWLADRAVGVRGGRARGPFEALRAVGHSRDRPRAPASLAAAPRPGIRGVPPRP